LLNARRWRRAGRAEGRMPARLQGWTRRGRWTAGVGPRISSLEAHATTSTECGMGDQADVRMADVLAISPAPETTMIVHVPTPFMGAVLVGHRWQ